MDLLEVVKEADMAVTETGGKSLINWFSEGFEVDGLFLSSDGSIAVRVRDAQTGRVWDAKIASFSSVGMIRYQWIFEEV